MNRASPVQLRKALEAADAMAKAGILFVAIPVLNPQDYFDLLFNLDARLERLEKEAAEIKEAQP
ncbi:DUF1382 family protein [Pseudomonas sp. URMO17WK12:I12]|uniref:DUF1382 family protein n=1 Tax=Pseudomonas sp. URMO17WK12:I12 TaxID=1259797 RepID=UPI0004813DD1|nr:DUF1382 family protein [Pseudomonas sp. URMO17WK12:I12]